MKEANSSFVQRLEAAQRFADEAVAESCRLAVRATAEDFKRMKPRFKDSSLQLSAQRNPSTGSSDGNYPRR
jgi:hypothetical protein